ncbi:TonB family protein [Crenothrix polyspora]|uniref:Protein TonB n=1 Tax=Crenothrix polyspora TaxID=360316 RepID=A0A1R4H4P3_9GAMM|nr:energy transducer TonB [Crenothrix polyspora]SJM91189.1 TonB family protein [Crenothrix polyspora]
MTSTPQNVKQASLLTVLASEVNHRSLLGLLAILVVLLHIIGMIWLLQPTDTVKPAKALKIVEVILAPKPKIEPKPEPKPEPKVVQPAPPKKIPPKKKAGKPPVKEKTPVVHKQLDQPKPKPVQKPIERPKPKAVVHKSAELPRTQPVLTRKPTMTPAPTTFASTAKKWTPPTYAPTSSTSASKSAVRKSAEKTGNAGHDSNNVSSGVVELAQAKTIYPPRARSRNIEGWVKIEFTVTASGAVTNAHVVGASPPGIFDAAALTAIQKFRFKPKMVNGKATNGVATKKFNFNLN